MIAMRAARAITAIAAAAVFTGCASAHIPFTASLRQQNKLTDEELKNIQYYVSDDIVLYRELASGERGVIQGRLVIREGKQTDEVVIPKETPGIALSSGADVLEVSFEEGSSFRFGEAGAVRRRDGKYYFLAVPGEKGQGKAVYGGIEYLLLKGSEAVYLVIDKENLLNLVNNRKVLPGRRISE